MRRLELVVMAGCGRIAFDPVASGDAIVSDDAPPWSTPELVAELASSGDVDDPTLTGDMLEIYFNSGVGQSADIWVAKRGSVDAPFGAPTRVTELNSSGFETTPEVSYDGLTIYFASSNSGLGGEDIFMSSRAARTVPWSPPVHVVELSSTSSDESACADAARTTLYLDTDRSSTNDTIFVARRSDPGQPWSMPVAVAELDGPDEEENPFLDASGTTIWMSVRTPAGYDIYFARRPTPAAPFGPLQRDPVSTNANDVDAWLAPDGRTLYFASDRGGTYEIYRATR